MDMRYQVDKICPKIIQNIDISDNMTEEDQIKYMIIYDSHGWSVKCVILKPVQGKYVTFSP